MGFLVVRVLASVLPVTGGRLPARHHFNTSRDRDADWGGQTLVLDDTGCLRKVFIVVVNRLTPVIRARRLLGDLPAGY